MSDNNIPIACIPDALDEHQRERYPALFQQVQAAVQGVEELINGFALRLSGATVQTVAEYTALERLCCPFLSFTLEIPAGENSIRLSLTGREGVKEFLQAELNLG